MFILCAIEGICIYYFIVDELTNKHEWNTTLRLLPSYFVLLINLILIALFFHCICKIWHFFRNDGYLRSNEKNMAIKALLCTFLIISKIAMLWVNYGLKGQYGN